MKATVKKYFIPHEENNYHPHILHTKRAVLYSGVAIAMKAIVVMSVLLVPAQVYVMPDVLAVQEQEIISRTNALRQNTGLLNQSTRLMTSARLKAGDMADHELFSHTASNGLGLEYFLRQVGYQYDVAGENLAMGYSTVDEVISAWQESPTHRANLLDRSYEQIGVSVVGGVYQGVPTTYIAQHFGTPKQVVTAALESSPSERAVVVPGESGELGTDTQGGSEIEAQPVAQPLGTDPIETESNEDIDVVEVNTIPVAGAAVDGASEGLPAEPVAQESDAQKNDVITAAPVIEQQTMFVAEETSLTWEEVSGDVVVHGTIKTRQPVQTVYLSVGDYAVQLTQEEFAGPYVGSIKTTQSPRSFFQTVVPATVVVTGADGIVHYEDLSWDNPYVVPVTAVKQYKIAKERLGGVTGVFDFSQWVYAGFLIFFGLALLINIIVEFRTQHHHVIAQSLGMLALVTFFYLY